MAWAQYSDETDLEEVLRKLDNSKVSAALSSWCRRLKLLQIDTFTFHLGINASAVAGRLRLTAAIANSLARLQRDAENAKALAQKLEEDLIEVKAEEGDASSSTSLDKPVKALSESGIIAVEERIAVLLEKAGLDIENLEHEQQLAKVCLLSSFTIVRNTDTAPGQDSR